MLIVGAAALMVWWSWGQWPDPLTDFGTQLYVPWRIVEGEVLYRDIAYYNGPLSQYINAAMFALFGVSLRTLVLVNLAIFAAVLTMVYGLVRAISNAVTATWCGLVVAMVFGFLQLLVIANYNWVTPYTHEVTHGVALSLVAIACLARYGASRKLAWACAASFATGLVFLTKAEVFVGCAASVGLGGLMLLLRERGARRVQLLAGLSAPAVMTIVLAWLLLMAAMPASLALRGTLGSWLWALDRDVARLPFYKIVTGFDRPRWHLWRIGVILCGYAAVLGPAALIALRRRARTKGASMAVRATLVVVIGAVLARGAWWAPWKELAKPLPLFVLIFLIVSVVHVWRARAAEPAEFTPALVRLMLAALSAGLLAKVVLNTLWGHYGFALAMPGAVLLVVALLYDLPRWIDRLGGDGAAFRAAAATACAAVTVALLYGSHLYYRDRIFPVGAGGDRFMASGRGRDVDRAAQLVRTTVAPGDSVAVLPSGLMINYLARRRHPNRHINFMPPEVLSAGDDAVARDYASAPPPLIVLVPSQVKGNAFYMSEGKHEYGHLTFAWMASRYELATVIHNPPGVETFGLRILRRK